MTGLIRVKVILGTVHVGSGATGAESPQFARTAKFDPSWMNDDPPATVGDEIELPQDDAERLAAIGAVEFME